MKNGLDAAFDYCRELTRREAKNFYYGFMLLPNDQRRAIYSVYAFARQADDIVDECRSPDEATHRLAAYRHAFEASLTGAPEGPVFSALRRTIADYSVPKEHFFDLIAGCETDITRHRYETFDALRTYCARVASSVGLISVEIFGYRGVDTARQHAADLGIALQLTNILRDLQEDIGRGRVYIPADEMEWFRYSTEDLHSGRSTPEFQRLMAYQVSRAREYFSRGALLLPYLPNRARACVSVMAGIYSTLLDEIEREPGAVFQRRVSLSTGRKLAIAGRQIARSMAG